jgi:MFS family permease
MGEERQSYNFPPLPSPRRCGLSPTAATLIACRVAQAICAATVTPQVLAIIRVEFAASERPIAIGMYSASMGLASITAQLFGGLLISLNIFGWSWRSISLVNVPIGFVAITLVSRMIRESRGTRRATIDLVGVALASIGLVRLARLVLRDARDNDSGAGRVCSIRTTCHQIKPDAADRIGSAS